MYSIKFEEDGFYLYEDDERVLELPPVATRYNLIYSILDAIISRSLRKNFSFETDKIAEYFRQAFIILVPQLHPEYATKEFKNSPKKSEDFKLEDFDACKRFLDLRNSKDISFEKKLSYLSLEEDENLPMQYASDDSDVPAEDSDSEQELTDMQIAAGLEKHANHIRKHNKTMPTRTHTHHLPEQSAHNFKKLNDAVGKLSLDKPRVTFNQQGQVEVNGVVMTHQSVFIPGFRAVNYMASRYSRQVRRVFRRRDLQAKRMTDPINHNNKGTAYFSEAVLQTHMDFYQDAISVPQIFDKNSALYQSFLQTAMVLQQQLFNLRNADYILLWDDEARLFNHLVHCMQHIYTNGILKFQRALRFFITDEVQELNFELPNAYNPFVSESEEPYHALKYGFGLKALYERAALRPHYDQDGRPRFPYLGEIRITLRDLQTVFTKMERNHISSLKGHGHIQPPIPIRPELEATAMAYLPEGEVVHSEVLKCPNFSRKYKRQYQEEFGLNKDLFELFQRDLKKATPGTPARSAVEDHILEWLCSYHAIRLMTKAFELAQARNGILQFLGTHHELTDDVPKDTPDNDQMTMGFRAQLAKIIYDKIKKNKSPAQKIFAHDLTSISTTLYAVSEKVVRDALKDLGLKTPDIQKFIDEEDKLRTSPSEGRISRSPLKRSDKTPKSSPYSQQSEARNRSSSPDKPQQRRKEQALIENLSKLFAISFDFDGEVETNLYDLVHYDVHYHIGDCLFVAIAAAVPGGQAAPIRALATQQIQHSNLLRERITAMAGQADNALRTRNGDTVFHNVAEYLTLMNQEQTWGTQIEIVALMQALHRPIVVITPGNQHDEVIGLEYYPLAEPIFLNYINNDHYQPLALPPQRTALAIVAEIQAKHRARLTPSVTVPVINSTPSPKAVEKPTPFIDSDDLAEVMQRLFI